MTFIKRHIFALCLGVSLISFTGCVNEDFEETVEESQVLSDTPIAYMPFFLQLNGSETTRAGGFDFGDTSELSLAPGENHFAIFYTQYSNKPKYIASINTAESQNNDKYKENYTIAYATLFGKDLVEDEELLNSLYSCIVILNSPYSKDDLFGMNKDILLERIIDNYYIIGKDGKKYFTMTSSTFIDEKESKTIETLVDVSKIYDNQIMALQRAYAGEAAVLAQVERLAAKFQLDVNIDPSTGTRVENLTQRIFQPQKNVISVFSCIGEDTIPVYETNKYSYQVKITGWGMNALERETFLFKQVSASGNYFQDWYDSDNVRCYWSVDNNYSVTDYPHQFRKAVDKNQIYYQQNYSPTSNTNILRNYSYDEIEEQSSFTKEFVYTNENTFDFNNSTLKRNLEDRLSVLAGTHLLLTAELLTDLNDNEYKANDVYRDKAGNFYRTEKEAFMALITSLNYQLKSIEDMYFKSYTWGEKPSLTHGENLQASTQGDYMVYYYNTPLTPENIEKLDLDSYSIEATIEKGDGQRLLWIDGLSIKKPEKEGDPTPLKIIDEIKVDTEYGNDVHYTREDPATEDELKSFILEWVGPIQHFSNGKMYYAVPVTHRTGINAVVRNHNYSFSLEGIQQIGTSVDYPDQPIVPVEISVGNRINFTMEILGWHHFEASYPGATLGN